jgi:TonB family protein
MLRFLTSLVAVAALPVVLHGQGSGNIEGTVVDSTGAPVVGAQVTVEASIIAASSDERGRFRLVGIPAGSVTLHARRLGFEPTSLVALVPRAGTLASLSIRLASLSLMLQPVIVHAKHVEYKGRLAGYYERLERRSMGYFITRDQIDRENPRQLSQLLQHVPGISAGRVRAGGIGIRMRGRNCAPVVWIDGIPMSAGEVDLDSFPPSTIQGVELYLGSTTAPMRYTLSRGMSSCGTILLWSRGPDTDPVNRPARPAVDIDNLLAEHDILSPDEVDQRASLKQGQTVDVPYPPPLFAEGVSGRVVAEFVVDTTGKVEEGTFGIVASTHQLLSDAVQLALRGVRFSPAVLKGRRVRQLVQQPFDFTPRTRRASGR